MKGSKLWSILLASVALLCAAAARIEAADEEAPLLKSTRKESAATVKKSHESGVPVMVTIAAKGGPAFEPLTDRRVTNRTKWLLPLSVAPGSKVAELLNASEPTVVAFVDGDGEVLGRVGPKDNAEVLYDRLKEAARKARSTLRDKLENEKTPEAEWKSAIESLVRLGAPPAELMPLLLHPSAAVKTAVNKALMAASADAIAIPAFDGLAAPEAEMRAACYRWAVGCAKVAKVPAVQFWKEGTAEERADALSKWREAALLELGPTNKDILEFIDARMGKKVGDGEALSLINGAFHSADAQPGKEGEKETSWGREVKPGQKILPGDIVQMHGCKFKSGSDTFEAARHAQVIVKVLGPKQFEVAEQNVNNRKSVAAGRLDLGTLTEGSLKIYRPLLK